MSQQSHAAGRPAVGTAATAGSGRQEGWPVGDALRIAIDRPRASVTVVGLDGELDSSTCGRLDAVLAEVLLPSMLVVIDLDDLTFVGSVGLSALIAATERADRTGAALRLVVAADNRVVGRPLEVTGLRTTLPIVGDLAAAMPEA